MRVGPEYAARKLNGEVTEFMLVTKPTKFEFVLNLKAAKQIGVKIAVELLARANQVIK